MTTTRAVWILSAYRDSPSLNATQLSPTKPITGCGLNTPPFQQGPLGGFLIRSSTAIFGDNEFGVRFWSPILAAGTSLLLYYFAQRLFTSLAGFWTVVALNVTPIFNLGSLVMTIDPLSIFFWMAAMFTFWLALERSPSFFWFWTLTGLLIVLGFF
jgi:4-amino-4-deoxy-L-arabinose transferase-like glycosyltransferase